MNNVIEGEFVGNIAFIEKQTKHRNAIELIKYHERQQAVILRYINKATNLKHRIGLKDEYNFHSGAIDFINQMILDLKYGE